MNNLFRVAIVDPNDSTRESLKTMLLGMDLVWLEAECSRYEFFEDVIGQTSPDIGIVSLDSNADKAIDLISNITRDNPECSILVVSNTSDGQLILRTMRAGVKEFLTRPVGVEDLVGALERISSQKTGGANGKSRTCQVIAVCGATGGVGTTSIAVNLGCTLASGGKHSVALIDLDLALGDADVFLDTIPDYTLVDVAQNISRLDFTLLKRSLTKHSSGLYLLPRPVQLQDTALITPDNLQRVFGLLKASFSHLILDLSKSFNEVDMTALKRAQQVSLVTQIDLPCLRNVVRLMMSFEEVEGLKEKVKIVVNRVGLGSKDISLKKAQETIGTELFWQLPNDYRVMVEVRNNGVPIYEFAPRASITQSFQALGEALTGERVEVESKAGGSSGKWLSFWPGKTKGKTEPVSND
ncbi:MAG: MinD/ParA family protein [Planctomycetales bacterium]|nr:MinD/ParA family protein [Planctomycetales bacterium]